MALTSAFVAAVRRQGAIPSTYASTDILLAGDIEIQGVFVPLLEQFRQNYFVRELTATPDARGKIPVPPRAIGATLRSVQLQLNNSWTSLPQRSMEDPDSLYSGQPFGYYLDAGSICLLPTGASGTVRVRYTARPGRMCIDTDLALCAPVTYVLNGPVTTTITSAITGGVTLVDIVSGGPAHQQKAIAATKAASIFQTAQLLEEVIVGSVTGFSDFVTVIDMTPFVPLPEELYAALVHRTAGVILRSLGYDEEAAQQLSVANEVIERAAPMLSPRNLGNPERIKGGLRRALNGRGRWVF